MGETSNLSNLIDRIRSGAKAHVTNRDGSRGSPVLPIAQPKHHDASKSATQQPPAFRTSTRVEGEEKPAAGTHPAPYQPASADSLAGTKPDGVEPSSIEEKTPPDKPPIHHRVKRSVINFGIHTKNVVCYSYVNILLLFVPVGIAVSVAHMKPAIVFAMNAIAIVPLAGVLSHTTENVAYQLGDSLGALLNVTFGNAVEFIIFVIALVKNEIRIVQASLLGSILANLLLILGMAFLLGGLRFREQIYNNTVTQMSACLLSLSVMSLLLPTAFHACFQDVRKADAATLRISRGTSVVLLLVYILYLLFQLKSHAYLYESLPQERIDEESHPGVLHNMLDSSSSSSSSDDSSSSDSDCSTDSQTTANKIKRAFRRRGRRKSTANSEDAPSIPSHVSSPGTEDAHVERGFPPFGERNRRGSILGAICSGDEADTEEDRDHEDGAPRVRDFEHNHAESSTTPQSIWSLDGKAKKRKHKEKKKKRRKKINHHGESPQVNEAVKPSSRAENGTMSGAHEVVVEDVQLTTEDAAAKLPFRRPVLPKLLSENLSVFVDPPPVELLPQRRMPTRPCLRRTSSLPDRLHQQSPAGMAHVSHVPSGGMVPGPVPVASDAASDDGKSKRLEMSRSAAVVMLLLATGLVAVCAEFLVDAIPEMVEESNVSQAFIGLIILPIVGNAAEHVTAVMVATKNKMDLAIGVAVGSSIQIALFITPLVVIIGWCMNREMSLYFNLFETVCLFVTAFVVNFLVLDGKSNYLEGTLLIASYIIIALVAYNYPDSTQQSLLGGADGATNSTTNSTANSTVPHLLAMLLRA